MKDLRIAIMHPSGSDKISLFNLFMKKKEVSKQTVKPVTYTRQAKTGKISKKLKLIDTS
jgi:hypothetical protein